MRLILYVKIAEAQGEVGDRILLTFIHQHITRQQKINAKVCRNLLCEEY